MPSSNAVTTAQIVRMMKRGENGSSNVSMGPLRQILPYYSCRPQPDPAIRTNLYTISGAPVTDMTAAPSRLANPPQRINPSGDGRYARDTLFAVQRNRPNLGLLNGCAGASRRESRSSPGRLAPARRRCSRSRARYDRPSARNRRAIPPAGITAAPRNIRCRGEVFQFADQLPRDQQRQRMQRIGDRADRRRLRRAGISGRQDDQALRALRDRDPDRRVAGDRAVGQIEILVADRRERAGDRGRGDDRLRGRALPTARRCRR